jgi:hypothetical protein
MAADLWGDGTRFTMEEIGKTLKVSTMTVSRDLRGLTCVKPTVAQQNRGGRPRKPEPEPWEPKPEPKRDLVIDADLLERRPWLKPQPELDEPPAKTAPATAAPDALTVAGVPGRMSFIAQMLTNTADFVDALPETARADVRLALRVADDDGGDVNAIALAYNRIVETLKLDDE